MFYTIVYTLSASCIYISHIHQLKHPKSDSKIPTKREKKFRQTFEKMEGFSFVTPITGLSRPDTGKEDDD
jgi:hypothetical protein